MKWKSTTLQMIWVYDKKDKDKMVSQRDLCSPPLAKHQNHNWLLSESESCAVMSHSLQCHGLYSPWNSPGQNTGVGSLSLLQEIFPTQGLNSDLPQWRQILYQLSPKGSLNCWITTNKKRLEPTKKDIIQPKTKKSQWDGRRETFVI